MNWKKILIRTGIVLVVVFVALVAYRVPYFWNKDKTEAAVAKIHTTKLTLNDVNGINLPPDPGAEADKTVAGVDANANGIRDDVELAIFKEYPNSARTRAVLLQYALALQLSMSQSILNTEVVTAIIEDNDSRALNCIWSISSRANMDKFLFETEKNENFVKQNQINTEERKTYIQNFYKLLGSYSSSNGGCDIDLAALPN